MLNLHVRDRSGPIACTCALPSVINAGQEPGDRISRALTVANHNQLKQVRIYRTTLIVLRAMELPVHPR